jgi:superfamily II DNA/RNA helicase
MSQHVRKRTVDQMRNGKFQLLVATDVAARGLDIKGISHVFNFDLPMVAEDYIHRIGRTGRGGATGTAISLIGPDDWSKLRGIEKLTGNKLEREVIPGLEPTTREPTSFGNKNNGRGRKGYGARGGNKSSYGNRGRGGNGNGQSARRSQGGGQRRSAGA